MAQDRVTDNISGTGVCEPDHIPRSDTGAIGAPGGSFNTTISPFSKVTVPEYIENRNKENTSESLYEAEQLSVGNPQLLQEFNTRGKL
jgi:hypothetical protein